MRDPERGPNGTHVSKVATLLWLLCAAHCFAVFVLQDSDVCFQHGGQSVLVQGQVSVTICTSVALFVPVTRLSNGTTWASSSAARPIAKCGHQHGCAVATCLLYKMWIGQTYFLPCLDIVFEGNECSCEIKYQLFSSSQGHEGFDPMPYVFCNFRLF